MSRRMSTMLLSVVALLLFVCNLSLWAWTTIVDTYTFVEQTSSVLEEEESREAIASQIVTRLLADRPQALAVIGDELESIVTGILASDLFDQVFVRIASAIHRTLTSGGIDEITIDVSRLREIVNAVAMVLDRDSESANQNVDQPDEIVLFEGRDFPVIHQVAETIPWVSVASGLLAAGIIAWTLVATRDRLSVVRGLGIMLAVVALVTALLILPVRFTTLMSFPTENQRVIAATLFDAYAGRLLIQVVVLLIVGTGLFLWARLRSRPKRATPLAPTEPVADEGAV